MTNLKIKDNVDLKELKKFKFIYNDDCGQYKYIERNVNGATYIYVNAWNRRIVYRQESQLDKLCLEVLYDLIQAGLVEKE